VKAVAQTDGFAHVRWDATHAVEQTTLDALIARFGRTDFVKIDVEGYEAQVLQGVSQPLAALSFEMIPAAVTVAFDCVDRLAQLGRYEYAVTVGERQRLGAWQSAEMVRAWLDEQESGGDSADIFARLQDA
jgi:hypothetical protein